ncbi:protein transporter tim9 [Tulasnella sp. 331]|nr:protein transporter tim9 [Tulasnella sp. 331]
MDMSNFNTAEQAHMQKVIETKQMQDFMKLYSGLVERCFTSCCNDFTSKSLSSKEDTCVMNCTDKFLKHSERVGTRFAEHNAGERPPKTCTACAQNVCVDNPALAPKKATVASGALVGAIVTVVILLAAVVAGYLYWRKRVARQEAIAAAGLEKNISPFDLHGPPSIHSVAHTQSGPTTPQVMMLDSPTQSHPSSGAPSQLFFNNGSPQGGMLAFVSNNQSTDSSLPPGGAANPFNDTASMSTMSTNVIPIAYVPPTSSSMSISDGHTSSLGHGSSQYQYGQPPPSPNTPSRPAREPGLDLRLLPAAVTRAALMDGSMAGALGDLKAPKTPYAASARSGYSGISTRSSIISTSSSVLYDRPTIVTSAKVGRQVLGVMRAEVVQVPSAYSSNPSTPGTATSSGFASGTTLRARTSVRSPLAGKGFTAGDVADMPPLPTPTSLTAAAASIVQGNDDNDDILSPSSMSTKSDPFSDMKTPTNNTQFLQGLPSPTSLPLPESTVASPISASHQELPPSAGFTRQHFPKESTSSFMSSTSRADSVLNGFAFMPPTPTEPLPPLAFTNSNFTNRSNAGPPSSSTGEGSSIRTQHTFGHVDRSDSTTVGLGRRVTNYSVRSTTSTGLDAFPFQFGGGDDLPPVPESVRNTLAAASHGGNGAGRNAPSMPTSVYGQRPAVPTGGQRASLDTLALSRDVDEYALPYGK